ncbi:MAG: hypothetical protein IIW18_01275 [Oscillospiraceae bacterium]|nr:hypothetical protein [Oscillospiraceae bacterium]
MKAYFEGDKDVFVFKPIPKAKRGRPKKDVTDINVGHKSNADHIRSMTDGELAEFLRNSFWGRKQNARLFSLKEWLKQPYEEENHDPT